MTCRCVSGAARERQGVVAYPKHAVEQTRGAFYFGLLHLLEQFQDRAGRPIRVAVGPDERLVRDCVRLLPPALQQVRNESPYLSALPLQALKFAQGLVYVRRGGFGESTIRGLRIQQGLDCQCRLQVPANIPGLPSQATTCAVEIAASPSSGLRREPSGCAPSGARPTCWWCASGPDERIRANRGTKAS